MPTNQFSSAVPPDLERHVAEAVTFYWRSRQAQVDRQQERGGVDQGARAAVTGGAQMDGFASLITSNSSP